MNRAELKQRELNLFEAYRDGDEKAKYQLLNSLAPVIQGQVNKYRGSGLPDIALKLEGRRLADKAIESYDPMQSQLNTHVTNNLKKLSRFVMNYQNIGHIPEPRILMISKYTTIYDNLESELGREPTVAELADGLQVSMSEIERLQSELRKDLSMTLQDDGDEIGFYFYAQSPTMDPTIRQAIEFVYFDADPVDKKIMEYMFGLGGVLQLTSKDISAKLHLNPGTLKKRQVSIAAKIKELV